MAISLDEELVSPTEAPSHVHGRPHVSTIWRWFKRGSRGVRLESIVIAGRRYTSVEAIERFIEATTAAADAGDGRSSIPSARQRNVSVTAAEHQLKAAKISRSCHPP